ncbi:Protein Wnt [Aphelenchoides besseyi]|nr:Protein Wnt [Aphelenchoides besseyi]
MERKKFDVQTTHITRSRILRTNILKVYLNPSPDYCEPDESRGIFGTHGRPCNISSMALNSCDLLCCHRGFDTEMRVVKERCKCKFYYCCRVECQTCERTIIHHTCK